MEATKVLNLLDISQKQSLSAVMGVQRTEGKSKGMNDIFSNMLNTSSSKGTLSNNMSAQKKLNDSSTDYNKFQYKDNSIKNQSDNPSMAKIQESSEELQKFEKEIVEAISQILGIDEEEIVDAMENLGLSVFELLNPQNLAQLVVEMTDTVDSAELIMDSDFLNLLTSVSELESELMTELDLNPKQMQELVELLGQMEVVDDTTLVEDISDEASMGMTELSGGQQIVATEEADEQTVVQTNPDNSKVLQEAKSVNDSQEAGADEEIISESEVVTSQVDEDARGESENFDGGEAFSSEEFGEEVSAKTHNEPVEKEDNFQSATATVTNATTVTNTTQIASELVTETITSYTSADTIDVIEQVVQNVRTSVTEDTTTLEMQLNPQNLGKVLLNISSKQGAVSAQFTATNELVKEALEAQLVSLKENLNQAGVKVDAIEVTVASHEFERNLEQDQSRQEEEGRFQEEAASGRRRNINLDSLDELSGVMTEEESLVAQMMVDNGNSVDLTA